MGIPKCIVITPDANRRWAKEKGLPATAGHRKGFLNGRKIVEAAFRRGVSHVGFWGASFSNLQNRSDEEKTHLFALLKRELKHQRDSTENVSFRLRGNWHLFTNDEELKRLAKEVEEKTSVYKAQNLTVLFGYDGEPEGDAALKSWVDVTGANVPTWKSLCAHAWTAHMPPVDLYIRTGSKYKYLSGSFMPFKLQNTLLEFPEKYWPNFEVADLESAFDNYSAFDAERRNGR